ncbi:response regulator transcription factor [Sphingobacterium sp. E70]|uniref:response regulator transcription factor n=1 Tax=Sphingobacterium TaxID=28453 RepID=UPI00359C930B
MTKRDMEILALVAKGNSSPQIAKKLFISPDRVRTHQKNLFRKRKPKVLANLCVNASNGGWYD